MVGVGIPGWRGQLGSGGQGAGGGADPVELPDPNPVAQPVQNSLWLLVSGSAPFLEPPATLPRVRENVCLCSTIAW